MLSCRVNSVSIFLPSTLRFCKNRTDKRIKSMTDLMVWIHNISRIKGCAFYKDVGLSGPIYGKFHQGNMVSQNHAGEGTHN